MTVAEVVVKPARVVTEQQQVEGAGEGERRLAKPDQQPEWQPEQQVWALRKLRLEGAEGGAVVLG